LYVQVTLRFFVPALQLQMVHKAATWPWKLAPKLICSLLLYWTLAFSQMMLKMEVTLKFGLSVRDVVFDQISRFTSQMMN